MAEAKRRRTNSLLKLNLSYADIARVLSDQEQSESSARVVQDVKDVLSSNVVDVKTPYGKLVDTMELTLGSGTYSMEFVNPFALLWECCRRSAHFRSFFHRHVFAQRGKLIFYSDGLTVGNPLNTLAPRATEAIYWSFASLPGWYLERDTGWFTFSILAKNVVGQRKRVLFSLDTA